MCRCLSCERKQSDNNFSECDSRFLPRFSLITAPSFLHHFCRLLLPLYSLHSCLFSFQPFLPYVFFYSAAQCCRSRTICLHNNGALNVRSLQTGTNTVCAVKLPSFRGESMLGMLFHCFFFLCPNTIPLFSPFFTSSFSCFVLFSSSQLSSFYVRVMLHVWWIHAYGKVFTV